MPSRRVNMMDPTYEPTDEDLVRLSREAFEGMAERVAMRELKVREAIEARTIVARAELEAFRRRNG